MIRNGKWSREPHTRAVTNPSFKRVVCLWLLVLPAQIKLIPPPPVFFSFENKRGREM